MRIFGVFGVAIVAALLPLSAQALIVTNGDPDAHVINVIVGSDTKTLTVEPGQAVEPECPQGCIVELDESGEQYKMEGKEEISIEGRVIFLDMVPGIGEDEYPDVEVPDPDQPMPGPDDLADEEEEDG